MNAEAVNPHELDDDEFDLLESLLTSDAVPADCMDVEMLDGYLAALLLSPQLIDVQRWLPGVWSADPEELASAAGADALQTIHLVLRYYNELATTLGAPDGWEPFCYASSGQGSELGIGDEWIEGFAQGIELWPMNWNEPVSLADAEAAQDALDEMMAPWEDEDAPRAPDSLRLQWLALARDKIKYVFNLWRAAGLPPPPVLPVELAAMPLTAGGRNQPCPCGSGEKYRKCCGD